MNPPELRDIDRARGLLVSGEYSLVLCRGGDTIARSESGLGPLVDLLDAGVDLGGYAAADRVAGKAAALLCARAGVSEVFAPVMSDAAVRVFRARDIGAHWERLAGAVLDRTRTGLCPMERLVVNTEDPEIAYERLRVAVEVRRDAAAHQR